MASLLTENRLDDNKKICYVTRDGKVVVSKNSSKSDKISIFRKIRLLLFEVFLPKGYPDSVSEDYTWYQIWDTLQACCSTFCSMLAVQAVLLGVGVGRDNATPLSAALAWFTKDGVGMISGITFAWFKGTSLDADCKKWRLFADAINDLAFCIELSIGLFQNYAVFFLCVSSALKAVVGVAGGATRAALTHHQATRGNTADVAAKDGSQETLVNLITMLIGIRIINEQIVQKNLWTVMSVLIVLHLFCNYRAVKSLRLRKFNEERYLIVLKNYLISGQVPSVAFANTQESVIVGRSVTPKKVTGCSIIIGESLRNYLPNAATLTELLKIFKTRSYLVVSDLEKNEIRIALKHNARDSQEVLLAYFHSFLVAMILKTPDNLPDDCPLMRVKKTLRGNPMAVIDKEYADFSTACRNAGWNLQEQVLRVGQWRIDQELHKKTN